MNFKRFLSQNAIPLTLFITGACVLVIEVVAVRFLSPYYGNTIFTVSSVLSVILGALSLGYYFGGKWADRKPSITIFYGIICLSGIILLTFYLIGLIILAPIVSKIDYFTGPIFISVMLFALPAFLLGTLSPYALKIQVIRYPARGVGQAAGNIFFLSTLGSIIGSLLAGFVLIPKFGINQVFIGTSSVLFLLGFIPLIYFFGERKNILTGSNKKSLNNSDNQLLQNKSSSILLSRKILRSDSPAKAVDISLSHEEIADSNNQNLTSSNHKDTKKKEGNEAKLLNNIQLKNLILLTLITFFSFQLFLAVRLLNDSNEETVYSKDGIYEKITIFDRVYNGRPVRFFMQDKSASGAMFLDTDDPTDMVYDYTKYYSVYKVFKPDIKKALVIGSGAYTIPKALLSDLTDISSTTISPSSENSPYIPSTTKSPSSENSSDISTSNTLNTAEIPDTLNTSDIPNTPNTLNPVNISDVPMTTDTINTAGDTEIPNTLNTSGNQIISNALNTSDNPNISKTSETSNAPNTSDTQIDVVDIEPSLQELSQKYFNLTNDPRLNSYTMDGRRFLNETDNSYDLIFSDVYYSLLSIPSHFTTQEFFDLAKTKLSPNGVFVANLIGDLSREPDSFILAQIKTFKSVFPNSYFIATESPNSDKVQNIIFIGINGDQKYDLDDESIINHSDEVIRSLGSKNIDLQRFELSNYPIFTDNYAPADYFTIQTLKRDSNPNSVTDGKKALNLIAQQIRYGPRYIGSEGHKLVQDFIIAESKAYADQVYTQSWDYLDAKNNTHELKNIIARINPDSQNRIILGTHYDSKKFANLDSKNKNEPVPGANDSASGTAVLLTLMQKIAISKPELNFGIDFIFFDGEEGDPNIDDPKAEDSKINNSKEIKSTIEWSPIGSTYFADSLINTVETSTNQQLTLIKDSKYAQYEQIPYEINITDLYGKEIPDSAIVVDMVCDKDLQIYKENSSVQNAPNLIESFWQTATKIAPNVFVNEIRNEIQDDHTSLNKIGIPSILLIDFEYPYFHTTKDTLDKCSDRSLETIVDVMYEYLISRK